MSRTPVIALAVLAAVILATMFSFDMKSDSEAVVSNAVSPSEATRVEDENGFVRKAFLKGIDLSEDGPGHTLILHPMATGDERRVVRDPAILRAAQHDAYYMDDPKRATTIAVMSVLFLSPAGMPADTTFATILKDKEVVDTFRCHPPYCRGDYAAATPHSRDLAGLLEASEPVALVTERFKHPDEARAAHYRALMDRDVVQILPVDLPSPNRVEFPVRISLRMPAILLETAEDSSEPLNPFDEEAFMARFTAAFKHAYPDTEAYRIGPLDTIRIYPPSTGWLIVSDRLDGPLRHPDGTMRGLGGIMAVEASVTLDTSPGIASLLLGDDPFDRMPDVMTPRPARITERLDTLAEEVLGAPCPGCFELDLPISTIDRIRVRKLKPRSYDVSYYRVVSP